MKTLEEIQVHLDATVNTLLGQHRGRVDVVSIDDVSGGEATNNSIVCFVKMSGGCRGCAGAKATLKSLVESHIKSFEPAINFVVDSTDHTDKTNAFFKE